MGPDDTEELYEAIERRHGLRAYGRLIELRSAPQDFLPDASGDSIEDAVRAALAPTLPTMAPRHALHPSPDPARVATLIPPGDSTPPPVPRRSVARDLVVFLVLAAFIVAAVTAGRVSP